MLRPRKESLAMIKIQRPDPTNQPVDTEKLLRLPGASLESLVGALVSGKTTARSVAAAHGMSPKQFNKALHKANCARLPKWMAAMAPLCVSTTGFNALITDDTVIGHRSGRVLPFGKVLFHQGWRRPLYAQDLVCLAWTDGIKVIILGIRHWVPNSGVTKHELLREMLIEAVKLGVPADWLLFDGWYLTKDLAKWCRENRIAWASRLRRDRLVETDQGPLDELWEYRTDELAAAFSVKDYRWYPEFKKYAKGVTVATDLDPRPLKIALVKPHYRSNLDDMKFWACSAPVDVPSLLRLTQMRWGIEVVFRYLKQHLGLEKCIIRTPRLLKIWWNLLWYAYNAVAVDQAPARNWARAKIRWLSRKGDATRIEAAWAA